MRLEQLNDVLSAYGYHAKSPSDMKLRQFYVDYDESDRLEAAEVWRTDWTDALDRTFGSAKVIFIVESKAHKGSAVFGITPVTDNLGQIWMLQSKSFANSALEYNGKSWPHRGAGMVSGVVQLSLQSFPTIFNFIPSTKRHTIRLLKVGGFEFAPDPRRRSDILFFAAGRDKAKYGNHPNFWEMLLS